MNKKEKIAELSKNIDKLFLVNTIYSDIRYHQDAPGYLGDIGEAYLRLSPLYKHEEVMNVFPENEFMCEWLKNADDLIEECLPSANALIKERLPNWTDWKVAFNNPKGEEYKLRLNVTSRVGQEFTNSVRELIITIRALVIDLGIATDEEVSYINDENLVTGNIDMERLEVLEKRIEFMKEEVGQTSCQIEIQTDAAKGSGIRAKKDRFSVAQGQILFDGKDLELPTGLAIDVATKLISCYGAVVPYGDLDDNSTDGAASEQLRMAKSTVARLFRKHNIPCRIQTKTREGYVISDLPPATNE